MADNVTVLAVGNRLDSASADDFRTEAGEAVQAGLPIIIDLSRTTFVDSAGLGSLVSLLKNCAQQQRRLYLAALTPQVRQIFELTRLYRLFDIFDNVEQARADLLARP
jgi:anti-sigma B factor antagonist